MSMVANPIDALLNANYIGILVWAVGLGFALRHGNDSTKNLINDVSHAVTFIVKLVIRFAPLGILAGLLNAGDDRFRYPVGLRPVAAGAGRLHATGGAGD